MILHVIPVDDKEYHAASPSCACHPLGKIVEGKSGAKHQLFAHNAYDLRERWERQEVWVEGKKPWVVVEER